MNSVKPQGETRGPLSTTLVRLLSLDQLDDRMETISVKRSPAGLEFF